VQHVSRAPWSGAGTAWRAALLCLGLLLSATGTAHAQQVKKDGFDEAWNKGQDLFNLGKYDEARVQFDKARELSPKLPGPWRYLGKIAKIQKRWQDCVEAYTEAIRLKPDSNNAEEVRNDLDSCRNGLGHASYSGTLPKGFGALGVTANVEGARVTVDGIGKGATPMAASPLVAGKHTVLVEKEGYLRYEASIEVVATIVVDVDAQLEVDPNAKPNQLPENGNPGDDVTVGWIVVASNAGGVAVLIDGKVPPSGPQASFEASPGEHTLEVSAPGYETYRRRIRVARGQKRTLTISLQATDEMTHQNRMGYVFFGVAAAAAATGVVFGLIENDAYEKARDAYAVEQDRPVNADLPPGLPETHVVTRAEFEDMRKDAERYALISNVSYGVAVVALGVSVYYFVQARPAERKGYPPPLARRSRWLPTVLAGGAGGVGAGLTFSQEIDW